VYSCASSGTFAELNKLKNLKVLDLGTNSIDLPIHEFYNYVLVHVKQLPKLEFLSFLGNPVEDKIKEFRAFITNELPKLKVLDWEFITKEVREQLS
jgi:Leucine-rich repeat (LRR) protein